jgi:N-formylglutamate deformylase
MRPMSETFASHRGTRALLVSMPHAGTLVPDSLRPRLQPKALDVADTDWHVDRLYAFVRDLGASVIVPKLSRYVIDLNRPPDDEPMYPGASNTGLCPVTFFSGEPLYREGHAPDAGEIERRRDVYWRPYHTALSAEIDRLHSLYGYAVLFDAHSIRSEIPWLFEGKLPDFNLGTAGGTSCAPSLRDAAAAALADPLYTLAVDGRFKGGYITRRYGRPSEGVHAVQLEICQSTYMEEQPPFDYDESRASTVQPVLRRFVEALLRWQP